MKRSLSPATGRWLCRSLCLWLAASIDGAEIAVLPDDDLGTIYEVQRLHQPIASIWLDTTGLVRIIVDRGAADPYRIPAGTASPQRHTALIALSFTDHTDRATITWLRHLFGIADTELGPHEIAA